MLDKKVSFLNLAGQERTEVIHSTIPFKKGEWNGEPLETVDSKGDRVSDAWVYPFGKKYSDGSYRYGSLLSRVSVGPRLEEFLSVKTPEGKIEEPVFKFSPELVAQYGNALALTVGIKQSGKTLSTTFTDKWQVIEQNGMRLVIEATERLGDFVATFRFYICNDQNLIKWELDITGSNPDVTDRIYEFDEIFMYVSGKRYYLNVRGAESRGAKAIRPYQHFRLMKGSDGHFGDGQKQMWHGELIIISQDPASNYSAIAAVESEMYGISLNWRDSEEAYGALGVIPETPKDLPDNGWNAIKKAYAETWLYMRTPGNPWDDYKQGLTKTPSQTGKQHDFAILKGWDVLHSAIGGVIETYRFLATEEAKRPGHYKKTDGTPVTHASNPDWIVWNSVTHYHFGVSKDRLGKTDPSKPFYSNNWVGKDWEHFSSNLLYTASLLTGSYQLRDEQEHEVELYLAGHTLPSEHPDTSTNGRFEGRAYGRPLLAMMHHDTILDRPEIVTHSLARFHQVVKDEWEGATHTPVKNWQQKRDRRYFVSNEPAWSPWNEQLGWIGLTALARASKDSEVLKMMVEWGTTLINYGWRINEDTGEVDGGHAVRWFDDGSPVPTEKMWDTDYWKASGKALAQWNLAVAAFAKDSPLFSGDVRVRAQKIYDGMHKHRMLSYNVDNPYDDFGMWTAISANNMDV